MMSIDEMVPLSEKLSDTWTEGRKERVQKILSTLPDDAHRSFMMGMTLMTLSAQASEEMARTFMEEIARPHIERPAV